MHAYPEHLARMVRRQWRTPFQGESFVGLPVYRKPDALPPPSVLTELLSLCYQASLLREEGRAVRFRLILGEPRRKLDETSAPGGFHELPFVRPLPLSANELRRLSAAADFDRTLIGVRVRSGVGLEIWGLVHTGEQWLRTLEGSRQLFTPLPPALVISVPGPGKLTVGRGSFVVARLQGGQVLTPTPSVLEATPRDFEFASVNKMFMAALQKERGAREEWATISPHFVGRLRRQITLRLLSAMRRLQHGGTLLLLPRSLARQRHRWQPLLKIKYAFSPGDSRQQLFTLAVRLLAALAREGGQRFGARHQITWQDYLASTDAAVAEADDAVTEQVRLVVSLCAVDGAVVMAQPLELLGFGAEISGQLPSVTRVVRALDSALTRTTLESTLSVGTRHRSAYRLCQALPGVVAVVMSQDGSMRIMKRSGRRVVYSKQIGTGVLDV